MEAGAVNEFVHWDYSYLWLRFTFNRILKIILVKIKRL
jgi:hypothetical protein